MKQVNKLSKAVVHFSLVVAVTILISNLITGGIAHADIAGIGNTFQSKVKDLITVIQIILGSIIILTIAWILYEYLMNKQLHQKILIGVIIAAVVVYKLSAINSWFNSFQ